MRDSTGKAAPVPLLSGESGRHHDQNFDQLPYDQRQIRLKVNTLVRDVYGFELLSASRRGPRVVNAQRNMQLEPARDSSLGRSHGFLLRL
jgi:hypothetical protein